jgi:uroporphyrinogen decarboxylase
MNSLERIQAAIHFEAPDRVPVIPQVFGHAARLAGVPLSDYVKNGALLARCQIQALERYHYDAVFALMDTSVETEALGSLLEFRPEQYPTVKSYALSSETDLEKLSLPDPYRAGRMPELLEAARIIRSEVGDDVLVVGCVLGPMTLATQLLGLEAALYLAIDEPDRFGSLLDFAADTIVRFGTAQIEAGAHLPIVFNPSASPSVVPYQFFREMELPRLKRVFSAFKQAGALAAWLHIAGPTGPVLPFYPEMGVDIANIDYEVNPLDAQQALPHTCVNGNIRPLAFVEGSQETISTESCTLMDIFESRGGFILSSGCEIPPESKPENVAAMVMAARQRG